MFPTRGARNAAPTGIFALHLGADHKADSIQHFSDVAGGTGIRFYKGALMSYVHHRGLSLYL